MNIGVREAIYICLECLVFGFLILIVSLFGGYARNALHTKADLNTQMTEISEYRDIYEFTMGCELKTVDISEYVNQYGTNVSKKQFIDYDIEDMEIFFSWNIDNYDDNEEDFFSIGKEWAFSQTILKGEDLIRFIGKFPNKYNIAIMQKTSNTLELNKLMKEESIEKWTMSHNMDMLGESELEDFYCFSVYDDINGKYDCIVFVETEYIDYLYEMV